MANRFLHVGGGFDTFDSGALGTQTNSSYFDSAYVDHCVWLSSGSTAYILFKDDAGVNDPAVAGEKLWLHLDHIMASTNFSSTNYQAFTVVDTNGYPLLSLWASNTTNGGGGWNIATNTGTPSSPVWTRQGTSFSGGPALYTWDLELTIGSPHSYKLYRNQIEMASGTISMDGITNVARVDFKGVGTNASGVSQVMATVGIPTLGGHVYTANPNAAGDSNTFTSGLYTDIDEAGYSDTDYLLSDASGQKALFNYTTFPAQGATTVIGKVVLATRARTNGTPPNMRTVRKIAGVETYGSTIALTGGFAGYVERLDMSISDFAAAQFGVETLP